MSVTLRQVALMMACIATISATPTPKPTPTLAPKAVVRPQMIAPHAQVVVPQAAANGHAATPPVQLPTNVNQAFTIPTMSVVGPANTPPPTSMSQAFTIPAMSVVAPTNTAPPTNTTQTFTIPTMSVFPPNH